MRTYKYLIPGQVVRSTCGIRVHAARVKPQSVGLMFDHSSYLHRDLVDRRLLRTSPNVRPTIGQAQESRCNSLEQAQ